MDFEGGGIVHQVPGDPGGKTKWGVSQRAYPAVNIDDLTRGQAIHIFKTDYWDRVRADDLPPRLRWDVVDFAFNAGVGTAGRVLQQSLNLCISSAGSGDYLKVDGKIGPATLFQVDDHPSDRLQRIFRAYRARHYLDLAHAGRAKFIHGWLKRVEGNPYG
jgi:lysozyme family protein